MEPAVSGLFPDGGNAMCETKDKPRPHSRMRYVDSPIGKALQWVGIGAAILTVSHCTTPYDSTDPVGGGRSGLGLRIDHFTGCHYLSTWGGLTPRLDAQGRQICSGPEGGDDAAWEDSRGPAQ